MGGVQIHSSTDVVPTWRGAARGGSLTGQKGRLRAAELAKLTEPCATMSRSKEVLDFSGFLLGLQ